jgi:hypothetical protein
VTEALGPYRAALTLRRRRSLIVLLVVAFTFFGVAAWSSYRVLNGQRRFLHELQTGTFTRDSLLRFGIACQGGPEGPPGPGGTPPPGPPAECQFVAPDGQPIGPTFQGEDPFSGSPGSGLSQAAIDNMRPGLIAGQKTLVRQTEQVLGPRAMFSTRVRALGTFVGIVFAVLLGATFTGAEFRWGVWRTLLTHEPRRGRVLAGKLSALWTLVAVGFVVALAVVSGVDVVMRLTSHVHASGGPTAVRLAKESGWAVLSLEVYATMAAAIALALRTSLAGITALLLAVGDHLLVDKYHWLRHYFPVQQIATLLPTPERITTAYVWFPRVIGGVACEQAPPPAGISGPAFQQCREILLKPIPHWRASAVLAGWIVAFAFGAYSILRARDVPQ